MSTITANSLAAAVGSAVKNVQFQPTAEVVARKILIIGTGNPTTEATNPLDTPVLVTSAEDVASRVGNGYMLHRVAVQAFKGSRGIETWMIQQAEDGAAVQAIGDVDFAGSTGVLAGTLWLYIAGIQVPVTVADADTADAIATATAAAINADSDLPVTAAVNGVTTSQVDITAKSGGPWGNDITIQFNVGANVGLDETLPTGVVTAVNDMASGTGLPTIQDALDALGTGDGANEAFFTDVIHGYGQDSTTLNAVRDYVGAGNDFLGLYDKVVHKPFRSLVCDTVADSAGLAALVALGDGRKSDRANGVVAVPGSANHPDEIAALAMGIMARLNNNRAEENYVDQVLAGIDPGAKSDRWTAEYNDRDTAVKAGVSPTTVKSGAVVLQNVVTFYHPDNVPQTSNGYREMRNISVLQNILANVSANFEQEKWKGITIVQDVTKVGNTTDREKARDTDAVIDDLVALAKAFESNAWIFSASFTIDELKNPGSVTIRTGGDGFDMTLKVVLSGVGNILDTVTEFDTSIAVFV
jgi:phage tail sheath gpL-like